MRKKAFFVGNSMPKYNIVTCFCLLMTFFLVVPLIDSDFPSPCSAQGGEEEVVINELMLKPGEGGVWVEIFNTGNSSVSVDDWLISDEDGLTYRLGNVPDLPAKGYIAVHFDDGESDTEFGQTQPNALHIYTGWKNVRFTRHVVDSDIHYARAAVGHDLLPGGNPEIIGNKFGGDRTYFYEPKPDMTQEWDLTPIMGAAPTHRLKPRDIDGDGHTDLVFNFYFGDEGPVETFSVYWMKAPPTTPKDPWAGSYDIAKVRRPEGLDAGRIDGDISMDIVVGSKTDDEILWYESPADPTLPNWIEHGIDPAFNQPGGLVLFDLDRDTDLDVVAVGSYSEEVAWYEHPANPVNPWTKHTIAPLVGPPPPRTCSEFDSTGELVIGDLDNDNEYDVVVSEAQGNRIIWYEYGVDPKGAWTPYIIDDDISSPSGLDLGDIDNDGDIDIVATAISGTIVWYPQPEQLREPNWPRYAVDSTVHHAFYVNATDLDGDGDLDLVSADQGDNRMLWYENEFLNFTETDQCALFKAPDRTSDNIIDFLAWGGDAGGEDDLAVTAGIWQDGDYVDCTGAQQNRTVARDRYSQDTDIPADWDVGCGIDSDIPTKGTMNYPYPINSQLGLHCNPVEFMGATPDGEPPESMPEGLCLANYSSHTFSINVTNPFGWSGLDCVELNISQGQGEHKVIWTQADTTFSVYDPTDSMTLVSAACIAETDNVYSWHLNFTILFHWWFQEEGLQDVKVMSRNSHGYETADIYSNHFQFAKSLNFTGEMVVRDSETNEILVSSAWVIPGQVLHITGPKVLYDTQEGEFYPADSQFNVALEDDEGSSWVDYTSACYPVDFTVMVPEDAPSGQYDLTLSISDLPAGAISNGLRTHSLHVDGNPVKFTSPSPDETTWNTLNPLQCSVRLTDDDSGIDGGTIEYRVVNGSTGRFGEWQRGPGMPNSAILEPEVPIDFPEGPDNWIQWRCWDVAGGGPFTSPPYRVPVDTRGVCFCAFYPPSSVVQYDPWAAVKITVTDFDGSGIDTGSIQVTCKPAGEDAFGGWYIPLYSIQNQTSPTTESLLAGPETLRLSVAITGLSDGSDNCIKFRAMDIAGNGYIESDEYNITVEYSPDVPAVLLVEPVEGSIVRTRYPNLRWQLSQPHASDDIHYKVYMSANESDLLAGGNLANALVAELAGTIEELDFADSTLPALAPNMTYFWTVIPVLEFGGDQVEGSCADNIWEFTVFIETSGVELASDITSLTLNPGESDNITVSVRNLGIFPDSFSLAIVIEGNLSADISTEHTELDSNEIKNVTVTISAPGLHDYGRFNMTVLAYAQSSPAYDSLALEVAVVSYIPEGEEPEEGTEDFWLLLLMTIVMILVIVTVLHYILGRGRQKEDLRNPGRKEIMK